MGIKEFEKELEISIKNRVKDIYVPDDMINKIKLECEKRSMKNLFVSKRVKYIIIAAVLAFTSVTCYATVLSTASKMLSAEISEDVYTQKQMGEILGIQPKYIEKFSNGYKLNSSNTLYKEVKSDEILLTYKNGEDVLSINVSKSDDVESTDVLYSEFDEKVTAILSNDDVVLYSLRENKTDSEEEYSISYNINNDLLTEDNVKILKTKNAVWTQDGVKYSLDYSGNALSKEDILNMIDEFMK